MRFINTAQEIPAGEISIYGAGGRAGELLDALDAAGRLAQVKVLVDSFKSGEFRGLPVLTREEFLRGFAPAGQTVVVCSTHYRAIVPDLARAGVERLLVFDPSPVRILAGRVFASGLAPGRITILDIGAREELAEAAPQEWEHLDPERLDIYGFDPDAEECRRVEEKARLLGARCVMTPVGLWSAPGTIPFHTTDPLLACSCFPFNTELLGRLRYQTPEGTTGLLDTLAGFVETTVRVDCLDNLAPKLGLGEVDFAKLDVQGAELEVLKGARSLLPGLLAAKVEVWFAPYHKGIPLFSEVDRFLRAEGLSFFGLSAFGARGVGRTACPVDVATIPRCADHMGQLVASDAYYFRDPLAAPASEAPPLERLLRLVVLAEAAHQQEYAFEVLGWAAGVPAYAGHAAALREIFNAAAADYAALAEPKENA
ncbi:MAG: FkbM family methyltransferase [Proteobacteria bacterium]|nr:FkbM family methyltransferase [Pseudomonadota bacterium]MBU1594044.1 FkbM family methyltransferase [Pseudomonadota bacterium]